MWFTLNDCACDPTNAHWQTKLLQISVLWAIKEALSSIHSSQTNWYYNLQFTGIGQEYSHRKNKEITPVLPLICNFACIVLQQLQFSVHWILKETEWQFTQQQCETLKDQAYYIIFELFPIQVLEYPNTFHMTLIWHNLLRLWSFY